MGRIIPENIPEQDHPTATLPPAGYDRREELMRRRDALQQEMEEVCQALEVEGIDPTALEPDTEILSVLDNARVTKPQPGFTYRWVQFKSPTSSPDADVMRHLNERWVVVKGDDPESVECKNVETTRTKGDLILMRIRTDLKEKIDQARKWRTEGRFEENMSQVRDDVDRASRKAGQRINLIEYNEMDGAHQKRLERESKKQFAKQVARGRFERQIREGTVPGAEFRR